MKPLFTKMVCLGLVLLAIGGNPTASFPVGAQEKELSADAVAQRFLAHLESNQPVSGIFEIQTSVDFSQLGGAVEQKRKDRRIVPEPSQQLLICRWAWTTNREVCEQLEGSKNALNSFLALPEGTLIGYRDKKYNLLPPEKPRADICRPALFYYMSGGNFWGQYLASAKYSLGSTTDSTPREAVNLIAMNGPRKNVLTLDPKTGKLYAAEIYNGGARLWKLLIDEFATSPDGRLFPTKARTFVYGNDPAKPLRTTILTARRVQFPSTAEVAGQFKLPIPANALIGDRILNAAIEPERPTEASEIITGDVPRKPFTTSLPDEPIAAPRPWFKWVVMAVFLAVPLVLFSVYFILRYLRARRASCPPPPSA